MRSERAVTMTNSEIVLNFIKDHRTHTYCDDCLSDVLHIHPRQQINQICNNLKNSKVLERNKEQCHYCSEHKLVNKLI
jgi:reverse gyrase